MAASAAGAGGAAAADGAPFVSLMPTTGIVDNVMAEYVAGGVSRAAQDGAAAVVIELNTPGGALDATSRITSTLLEAPLPTIVWVAPAGSRAASAGTFITLSAHVALMAEGTNIGAATPISSSGEDIPGSLGQKVRNDAVANITAIAQARGRNVDWAVSTVTEAKSSPAAEAVALGAVDGIANTIDDVLHAASGRTVRVRGQEVTLTLAGAEVRDLAMNPLQAFLHLLSDPNVAFILFTLGFYGLLFELQNPNFVTGILGALAIILAFIGFGSLPLNVGGLLLIGLGIVLFILEATVTSHGLLTVGGLVAFALGASALYTTPGDPTAPNVAVALPLVVGMTIVTALVMALIAVTAVRSRRLATSPALVGADAPQPGTPGEVRRPLAPLGSVYAAGEEWTATSADGRPLERGTKVRIVARDGLVVIVEPVAEPDGPPGPPPARARSERSP
jgi:membrane-bound serine protease (ClpP class)